MTYPVRKLSGIFPDSSKDQTPEGDKTQRVFPPEGVFPYCPDTIFLRVSGQPDSQPLVSICWPGNRKSYLLFAGAEVAFLMCAMRLG